MRKSIVLLVVAACGSGGAPALPPMAPMPPGPGWLGAWSTTAGALELKASADLGFTPDQVAQAPILGKAAFRRDGAILEALLTCAPPEENHLFCAWDEYAGDAHTHGGMVVLVMNADAASFVANWARDRETPVRVEGRRGG